jgi:hypothetical protein
MKFMVTAHGRSGTTFLARALNQAPGWTVHHEALRPPAGADGAIAHRDLITPKMVRDWFNRQTGNYGMVNGYLRAHGHHAPVDVKGLIMRDPYDVALSVHNRGNWENFEACCAQDYRVLDEYHAREDFVVFEFHDMFKPDTFRLIAASLGVTKIDLGKEYLLTKVNASKGRDRALPPSRLEIIKRKLGWFREKHYGRA